MPARGHRLFQIDGCPAPVPHQHAPKRKLQADFASHRVRPLWQGVNQIEPGAQVTFGLAAGTSICCLLSGALPVIDRPRMLAC